MLNVTAVSTNIELLQIHHLNQQNLKQKISEQEKKLEGFVSWLYPVELLMQMNDLASSVIVKDDDIVVGYALTAVKEAAAFHKDLQTMMENLKTVTYKGMPLFSYRFYCMGQICIQKSYRGKGLFNKLYQKHKELYSHVYDILITEISSSNVRSLEAHDKVGFKTIYTHTDQMDEWNVVVWDWK